MKSCLAFMAILTLMCVIHGCASSKEPVQKYPELPVEAINITGDLPALITESSGQIMTPYGTFLGHNDSGAGPELYEYTTEGILIRKITVENAENVDWEDIALGGDTIYIADTGNNAGWRKWLDVYCIALPPAGSADTALVADRIRFRYPDRGMHVPHTSHNYDCEALIVRGDRLLLFSKNHANYRTTAYSIPRLPGEYVADIELSFDSHGLVTGADTKGNRLILLGYAKGQSGFDPFIWLFDDYLQITGDLSGHRVNIPLRLQTEAICFGPDGEVLFTNEEEDGDRGVIMRVDLDRLENPDGSRNN